MTWCRRRWRSSGCRFRSRRGRWWSFGWWLGQALLVGEGCFSWVSGMMKGVGAKMMTGCRGFVAKVFSRMECNESMK